jgi:hypothetical protein
MEGRMIELLEAILAEQKITNEELRKITSRTTNDNSAKERMAEANKMVEKIMSMVPGMGGQNGK